MGMGRPRTFNHKQITAAMIEWERRVRANPESFKAVKESRLTDLAEEGAAAADYLFEILVELFPA